MLPEKEKSIRMPYQYTSLRRLPTTLRRFAALCNYMKISAPLRAEITFEMF